MVRIFVVDDNASVRTYLRTLLEQRKEWSVVGEACNGRHAVETCHEYSPHITVMDLMMPEMNGLEAARHLNNLHPHIPILMVTTDPTPQLEEEAQEAGISGLCPKARVQCLFAAIAALLRGEKYFRPEQAA